MSSDVLHTRIEDYPTLQLYRALDKLLPHKEALEQHLTQRLGELFQLEYDLLLYDLTSTYFEGAATHNALAQRGYSRDHRPDCKQVNIAVIVSREGMPLGHEVAVAIQGGPRQQSADPARRVRAYSLYRCGAAAGPRPGS